MPKASYPIVLDIDKSRSIATESSFESSELSTPCSLASQSTTELSVQDSVISENDINSGLIAYSDPSQSALYYSGHLLRTSQMPARPPLNFGTVIVGNIYRSSYPLPENFEFLSSLNLRTILTLVPQPIPDTYVQFIKQHKINHVQLNVPANKEQVQVHQVTIGAALSVALDPTAYPLLIHCNKGKHRTGCLVACFRKWHGMSLDDAIVEYRTFAHPKARPLDELFIKSFNRDALLQFARGKNNTGDSYMRNQATVIMDTMATGGKLDENPADELRSITTLRNSYARPTLSGS